MTQPRSARRLATFFICVVMLGGAVTLAVWLRATRLEPPRREVIKLPPLVGTHTVEARDVSETFSGYGEVVAMKVATLSAEVASTVLELADDVRPGSPVSVGQTLLRLDDREHRHAMERAEAAVRGEEAALAELDADALKIAELISTARAELRVAEDEKRRLGALFEGKNAAEREYNVALLAYQQAQRTLQGYQREAELIPPRRQRLIASRDAQRSNADIARLNVERCVLRAPYDGRVETLRVEQGDRVGPGTPCLTMVNTDRVEIPIRLPAGAYELVGVGAPCAVQLEGDASRVWTGEVARLAPVIDSTTRTFAIYVVVDNRRQEEPLAPGRFVRAVVTGPAHRQALLAPRAAVRDGHVFVLDGQMARQQTAQIVRTLQDMAIVQGDIRPGDRIIVTHLDALEDGLVVRTSDAAASGVLPHSANTPPGEAP